MKILLNVLISFIPSLVFAKHFHKFPAYDANASYTRGKVVLKIRSIVLLLGLLSTVACSNASFKEYKGCFQAQDILVKDITSNINKNLYFSVYKKDVSLPEVSLLKRHEYEGYIFTIPFSEYSSAKKKSESIHQLTSIWFSGNIVLKDTGTMARLVGNPSTFYFYDVVIKEKAYLLEVRQLSAWKTQPLNGNLLSCLVGE